MTYMMNAPLPARRKIAFGARGFSHLPKAILRQRRREENGEKDAVRNFPPRVHQTHPEPRAHPALEEPYRHSYGKPIESLN